MATLQLDPRSGQRTHRETVAAGATSQPLLLPHGLQHVSIIVSPGATGTARVEYTLDPHADVEAGAATVKWIPWPHGDVGVDTMEMPAGPISALRCVAATVDAEWRVLV